MKIKRLNEEMKIGLLLFGIMSLISFAQDIPYWMILYLGFPQIFFMIWGVIKEDFVEEK